MRDVICLVGCGFLGSHLTDQLAKLMYSQELGARFRLRLIDYDTWDERNPANQFVTLSEAIKRAPKVETLAARVEAYGLTCEPREEKLEASNAASLLEDAFLIIDAVDHVPTRQLLWGISRGTNTPCIHLGISKRGTGQVTWSCKTFDDFPYTPQAVGGRKMINDDLVKEPPCEMFNS